MLSQNNDGLLAPPDRVTVEQLCRAVIEDQMAESALRTVEYALYTLEHYFTAQLRSKRVQDVSPSDPRALVADLRRRKLQASVRSKTLGLLKRVMREAAVRRIVPFSPVAEYTMPRAGQSAQRDRHALTRDQTEAFLAAARDEPVYAAIYLMFAFGLRRGEALGLRWQDFDLERRRLSIRQQVALVNSRAHIGRLKTQSSIRDISLTDADVAVLSEHKVNQASWRAALGGLWPDNDLVTTTEVGSVYDPHNLSRTFRELGRRTGLLDREGHFGTHVARKTSITLCLREGQNVAVVAKLVGHARTSMTMDRYWVTSEDDLQAERITLNLGAAPKAPSAARSPAN